MRVVATAGHVDHGKSTLVLALTGTDPDRFPEEKARGLTIDLGFAFTTLPSGTDVGFVDVPGHTRFIKNMLAGVGAVDVAMLVVAANEGWKPQSEEHLRILDVLGIRHGIVVVTKSDLVDLETLEIAQLEVQEHVEGTTVAGLEIVTCDARTGTGLDTVRAALDRALAAAPSARDDGRPRLWIDRVFVAKGAGTVVTGTLTGGTIAVDDELEAGGHRVRVRGIESHGAASGTGAVGARVALNLAGVDHHEVHRGDAVVHPDQWRFVTTVDVSVDPLPGVEVKRRGRLAASVGSGEHPVWIRRLDGEFARVRFDRPLPFAPGDRMVLRDTGAHLTVAGATVLDTDPTRKSADAPARLRRGLPARLLETGWIPDEELEPRSGIPIVAARALMTAGGAELLGDWFVAATTAAMLREQATALVADGHAHQPAAPGTPAAELAHRLRIPVPQLEALAASAPDLVLERGNVRHREHEGDAADSAPARALLGALGATPLAPPPPADRALAAALARAGAR
ncbi:MAG: selenocysteine-specific translation elongation factor, partial [Acidimicrobiia bacterium]